MVTTTTPTGASRSTVDAFVVDKIDNSAAGPYSHSNTLPAVSKNRAVTAHLYQMKEHA